MARIVCCGEGMLELAPSGADYKLGYGGDTLNTAVHMARLGQDVAYLTAVGNDPFSARLKEQWAEERLDTDLVLQHPRRTIGLYAITVDDNGERSFTYWRDASAAREMFSLQGTEAAVETASSADLLYFSLLTLAILPPRGRQVLLELAAKVRVRGGQVAYDNNYRARLWATPDEARAAHESAIRCASVGLPTLEDEMELQGSRSAAEVQRDWKALGCTELVIKLGSRGCLLPDGTQVSPDRPLRPVDTSGAGDAFNAGYLTCRMKGAPPHEAGVRANDLAAWNIMRRGALPPRDASYPGT